MAPSFYAQRSSMERRMPLSTIQTFALKGLLTTSAIRVRMEPGVRLSISAESSLSAACLQIAESPGSQRKPGEVGSGLSFSQESVSHGIQIRSWTSTFIELAVGGESDSVVLERTADVPGVEYGMLSYVFDSESGMCSCACG